MKRFVLNWFVIIIPTFLFGSTRLTLYPYGALLNYSNTQSKTNSVVSGLYGYFGIGRHHAFEGDLHFTKINHGASVSPFIDDMSYEIDQRGLTLAYSNYSIRNVRLQLGTHIIKSDDALTHDTQVLFGGFQYYRPYLFNVAINGYQSFYDNYSPSFVARQLTTSFGFYFGNYFTYGQFYSETKANVIDLSEDIGFGEKRFYSIEQSLTFMRDKWSFEAFLWTGARAFAVQNDGFIVYNLAEKHLSAVGGAITRQISDPLSLTLSYTRGRFKETGFNQIAVMQAFSLMFNFTF